MLYKVFIDDSGSKDYLTPYSSNFIDSPPSFNKYEKFWRDNYFVLCGVRIEQENIGEINNLINRTKEKYFKTKKVEIKSDWLRNPHKKKKNYLNKFGISDEELLNFTEEIYDTLSNHKDKVKLLAVVFDKRFYGDEKRNSAEGNPLLKTSQVIFERLQYLGAYNIVVFDQMESSLKANKGDHGKILKALRGNDDMEKIFVKDYDKIVDIKFIESCNENFLQIADICAYNIFRQFTHYGREWSGVNKNYNGESVLNMYKYFSRIRCNFIHLPRGLNKKVCGVGMTCIPDFNKCEWDLMKGCDI